MKKPKIIYCPQCKIRAFSYDGRSTMNKYGKCRNCKQMVCYYPDTDEVKLKPLPQRASSSGMTFI